MREIAQGAITGDLHWGLRVEELDRTPEVAAATNFVVDEAIEERADFVIFGGDIFDNNHPLPDHMAGFIACLARLEREGIATFVMGGNHEAISAPGRFWALTPAEEAGFRHVRFVKEPRLMDPQVLGFPVLFLPHVTRATASAHGYKSGQAYVDSAARELLDGLAEGVRVVVFCHYNLRAAKAGTEANMLKQSDLELPTWMTTDDRIAKIFAHHVHIPQEFANVHVVGSPICTDFGDSDDKSYTWAHVYEKDDGRLRVKAERFATPQAPLIEFELDFRERDLAGQRKLVAAALKKCTPDAIVKLRVLIEEERMAELDAGAMREQFRAHCRAVRAPQVVQMRAKKVRDGSQTIELKPAVAVDKFLEARKPEGAARKRKLALALMAGEPPRVRRGDEIFHSSALALDALTKELG